MEDSNEKKYRQSVGIMLFNKNGMILTAKRNMQNCKDPWQMPQGGIEKDEDIICAAKRELYEETGVKSIKIIAQTDKKISYIIPAETLKTCNFKNNYIGQEQIWILMLFVGEDSEINLTIDKENYQEFTEWKWTKIEDTIVEVAHFKKDVYKQVVSIFQPIIYNIISKSV